MKKAWKINKKLQGKSDDLNANGKKSSNSLSVQQKRTFDKNGIGYDKSSETILL